MQPIDMAKNIVKTLDEKKAHNIEVIRVSDVTILADYFIIASANNATLVKALADETEHALEQKGVRPSHVEGRATQWILIDYASVVVHVFYEQTREFYSLERLWKDGERIDVEELINN